MKINKIREIEYLEESVEVTLDVEFDKDFTNRWELADPYILAVYTKGDDNCLDYVELLEQGMIVHGYEMNEDEMQQVSDFLDQYHVKEKIENGYKS
ncbi:hypothetical protein HNQ80_001991 [Anaerosolibacter carboniphilus]|uniref:Uncharacterized protein n=1 Tax=Anaerosolibacter carboniphilus TaxID=1417629 RepID=A0A841KV58_9FIRM|nr:hypothetical protein [Anaerosolibacter carboniphilus]MBB6215900.1 hypothetical protein [Anaerosolibacter carboniphilus]